MPKFPRSLPESHRVTRYARFGMSDVTNSDTKIAETIASVLENVSEAAKAAGRDPASVQVLAISKRQPLSKLQAAYKAGLRDFGENYMQGLDEHAEQMPDDLRWHFIGHVQSKKAKKLAWVHRIHSVDSSKLLKLLASCGSPERPVHCLVQVNLDSETSKSGVAKSELSALLDYAATLANLEVRGLMCIPDPTKESRDAFCALRELRDIVKIRSDFELPELSMGMSSSYCEAIAEGATIVRVGTAIFGMRELLPERAR